MNDTEKPALPLSIWFYGTLWIFFVYLYIQILQYQAEYSQNLIVTGMYFVEFGVHEASHIIFGFLPTIMVAAAGSIGEITFTCLIVLAAWKSRSYFAAIFGSLWVMLAMNSAGRYMADARAQQIPLIGPGDTVQHDWNFVFGQLGWLNFDTMIGGTVRGIGNAVGIIALATGLWLIVQKIATKSADSK